MLLFDLAQRHRRRRRTRGQSLVEFALILPLMMVLLAATLDLLLTTGAAWAPPPPPPCQVPHMIDKRRPVAQSDWTAAHFNGSFSPTNGNFVVKNQSIPGFSWVPCASSITVSNQP